MQWWWGVWSKLFKPYEGVRPHVITITTGMGWGCSVSLSVYILANNALRAHHASVHGGLSANGLSDICLSFFEMILLSFLK